MVTALSLLFCLGFCFLICSGIFLLMLPGDHRLARSVRETPPTPVGSWRAGLVAAEGFTHPGPGGYLRAPVSGETCAWFRLVVARSRSRDDSAPDVDVRTDHAAPPPAFGDHTGRVTLDPRLITPRVTETTTRTYGRGDRSDLPHVVPDSMIRSLRKHETLEVTETRLPAELAVYVMGTFQGSTPLLQALPASRCVLVRGSRDDHLAELTEGLSSSWLGVRAFTVIGLVLCTGSGLALWAAL